MDLNSMARDVLGESDYSTTDWTSIIGPTLVTVFVIIGIFILFIFLIAYIYNSYTLYKTAKRLNHPQSWLSWIPIANYYIILTLGDMSPLFMIIFVFPILLGSLAMIPQIGFVFTYLQAPFTIAIIIINVICYMNISKKRGYSKELGLMSLNSTTALILMGILAWGKNSKEEN